MTRSRKRILKQYEKLVRYMEQACKSLDWKVKFEPEDDSILFVIIDKCRYFVSPAADCPAEFPLFSAFVMVHYHATREEPSSDDETPIGTSVRHAEHLTGIILDAHWSQRKEWAMEATIEPEPEYEQ